MSLEQLPIDHSLPEICSAVAGNACTIVEATPGSGKTTRVAPSLLENELTDQKVYLLQPRRVAARAAAERIAFESGVSVGSTIGYQVRFDNQTTSATRLVVATEGVLLRRLQNDALLADIGIVVFDEFHERSLNADLLLARLRKLQLTDRPDLRLVVMSATLGGESLEDYIRDTAKGTTVVERLNCAVTIQCKGRQFAVQQKFRPPQSNQRLVEHVADTVVKTCEKGEPDILVFLPGVGEINGVARQIQNHRALNGWDILTLHGQMPLNQQSRVLVSSQTPRVILSTNVAETSLTIHGVRTVIDSGQARVMRFEPSVGLDRLSLEPISQASAKQRTGRAGRLAEGTCIRLWSSSTDRARSDHLEPEIRRVDVTSAALQLHSWGEGIGSGFPWLQPPRDDSWQQSQQLLELLGAIDKSGLTGIGKQMSELPLAPRLARFMVESYWLGVAPAASIVAAMLSERDPFLTPRHRDKRRVDGNSSSNSNCESDTIERLHALQKFYTTGESQFSFGEIHRDAARNIDRVASQLVDSTLGALGPPEEQLFDEDEAICRALLAAFPDRLAKRRNPTRPQGIMVGGRGVTLSSESQVKQSDLFLCIETFSKGTEVKVTQASAVEPDWLPGRMIVDSIEHFFHPSQKSVVARQRRCFAGLIIDELPTEILDRSAAANALFAAARPRLNEVMPKDDRNIHCFVERTKFLSHWLDDEQFPSCDDSMLESTLHQLCQNCRSIDELRKSDWLSWIRNNYTPEQIDLLDREAPQQVSIPSGSKITLVYDGHKPPVLAAKIQEMFSMTTTPVIAKGRVPLLLHLLAPNNRPQQVTNDLESFWANTYSVIRKELKRRYSKHDWPEDPYTAKPSRK